MSFLLIGAFLGWEIYRSLQGRAPRLPNWKLAVYGLAIAMCLALFVAGMRLRHRPHDGLDDESS